MLEDHRDAFAKVLQLVTVEALHLDAVDLQAAGLVGLEAVDAAKQRGFARTALAHKAIDITALDAQVDVVENDEVVERLPKPFYLNHSLSLSHEVNLYRRNVWRERLRPARACTHASTPMR